MKFSLKISFALIILIISLSSANRINAYNNGIEDNDFITFGYHLIVDAKTIEFYNENSPRRVLFTKDIVKPIGFYNRLLGMKIGEIKNFDVPASEGFSSDDPKWSYLAGKALHYQNVQIYDVEGVNTETTHKPYVNIVKIIAIILGVISTPFIAYGSYKLYKKLFYKRCSICKKPAVGRCSSCGALYCATCFSNGCPKCGSRKLIRFSR